MSRPQKVPQSEYDRVLKNLKRQFKAAEKAGVDLSGIKIPAKVKQPTTASIAKIEAVKSQISRQRAAEKAHKKYISPEETAKREEKARKSKQQQAYKQAKQREKARQRRARERLPYGARGDLILDNFRAALDKYDAAIYFRSMPKWFINMRNGKVMTLKYLLEGAIGKFGEDEIVKRIELHATEFNELFDAILFAYLEEGTEDAVDNNLERFKELLYSDPLTIDEKTEEVLLLMR